MGLAAMAGSHRAIARLGRASALLALLPAFRRRSSVVEHVIGNDGVSSSILLGGTNSFNNLAHENAQGQTSSKHIVSTPTLFRALHRVG